MQRTRIFRMAFPVNVTGPAKTMLPEGWAVDPKGARTPPGTTITNLRELDPEIDLSIPKIYKITQDQVRTIDGKDFLLLTIDEPRDYQRVTKRTPKRVVERLTPNPDGKTQHFPGIVRAIDLDTGEAVEFDAEPVLDIIRAKSQAISEETRARLNKEIRAHNERLSNIDAAAADLTRLPLQLGRARDAVEERIAVLEENIIPSKKAELAEAEKGPPSGVSQLKQEVEDTMLGATLDEKNMIDHVITNYVYRYDQLVSDLSDPENPTYQAIAKIGGEPLVEHLKDMGQLSFDSYMAAQKSKDKPSKKEPFDLSQFPSIPIQEIPEGGIPVQEGATGHRDWGAYVRGLKATISNAEKDKVSLKSISKSLEDTAQWIGSPAVKNRGIKALRTTPEGQEAIAKLRDVANNQIGNFAGRYKRDIIDKSGNLDTAKLSREGTLGNALLIPVFARLYNVIKKLLENAGVALEEGPQEGAGPVPEQVPAEQVQTASSKKPIITQAMWLEAGRKASWVKTSAQRYVVQKSPQFPGKFTVIDTQTGDNLIPEGASQQIAESHARKLNSPGKQMWPGAGGPGELLN